MDVKIHEQIWIISTQIHKVNVGSLEFYLAFVVQYILGGNFTFEVDLVVQGVEMLWMFLDLFELQCICDQQTSRIVGCTAFFME